LKIKAELEGKFGGKKEKGGRDDRPANEEFLFLGGIEEETSKKGGEIKETT